MNNIHLYNNFLFNISKNNYFFKFFYKELPRHSRPLSVRRHLRAAGLVPAAIAATRASSVPNAVLPSRMTAGPAHVAPRIRANSARNAASPAMLVIGFVPAGPKTAASSALNAGARVRDEIDIG